MNEDLKWLAENVHEWPKSYSDLDRILDSIAESYAAAWDGHQWGSINGFTRAQWQAARDELSGKPEWSDAPEYANWLAQDEDGEWWWFEGEPKLDSDCFYCHSKREDQASIGRVLGDWRKTLERRPENHSAEPTEKVLRGPEDRLPPVGVEFEFSANGKTWEERVMLFNDGITCLMAHKQYPVSRWHYKCDDPDILYRPIRSEEDKAVDEMMKFAPVDNGSMAGIACQYLTRALYRAGYRKQEDK